uniref:Ig-like domain-containing protein n=1 Tax=Mola mola TaxID=94237 RepID=A0A3Q3XBR6_MOLML
PASHKGLPGLKDSNGIRNEHHECMPSIPEEDEVLESEAEKRTMPDFVKPLADMEVVEGREAVLKCKVAGLPYPTISWHHNGKRIESSEDHFTFVYDDPEYSLVVLNAGPEHSGVYTCTAKNLAGSNSCKAELTVHTADGGRGIHSEEDETSGGLL